MWPDTESTRTYWYSGWSLEDPYQEPEREKLGAAESSEAYPE